MFGMQPLRKICCIWETVPNLEGKRYGSLKSGWKFKIWALKINRA
ncbi:hypothetical protein LEP1GSC170_5861 [Leptospira interrogans serovar Bataviae str. HAI135]|nr:hypothetical protein LEP1GSC170_5861 [Leptospira interrogans serovar Bataviae str. HAI135]